MRNNFIIPVVVVAAIVVLAFRALQLALASLAYIYLLPGVIAMKRDHPRQQAIYVVCAVGSWLVLPWLGALWYVSRAPAGAPRT
jgi:hypothetical protein